MSKKIVIGALFLILFGVFAAGCGSVDYMTYSDAFKKTFGDSLELNTSVKASLDGGSTITSTGTFKLKGMESGNPQFINTMVIDGKTVTQFCDGEFVYTDDGASKNKMKIGGGGDEKGGPPNPQKDSSEFSYDSYLTEFSSLIDAAKIKEMGSLEPIAEKYVDKISSTDLGGGKQFDVVLLPAIVDELKSKFLDDRATTQNSPTINVEAIKYSATIKDGYVQEIVFNFEMNITAPGDSTAKEATVDLTIKPVNPGQAVEFDLPGTEGF